MLQERYGAPALTLVGFRLWIHGRQFPQSTDESDGNWLVVSVCCETEGAVVWVENDPALEVPDIQRFLHQCVGLRAGQRRKAGLNPVETLFEADLTIGWQGSLDIEVQVTQLSHRELPLEQSYRDLPLQHHEYHFGTTYQYLDRVIDDCQAILAAYPAVGELRARRDRGAQEFGFDPS